MAYQPFNLKGKVALVAGATRGAGRGTAIALGEAGATVYCTGRSTRQQRSEYDRPETIEETAELVTAAGGTGIAVAVDHLFPPSTARLIVDRDLVRLRVDLQPQVLHLDAVHLHATGGYERVAEAPRPDARVSQYLVEPFHEDDCTARRPISRHTLCADLRCYSRSGGLSRADF